jgi:hypothetical protein
MNYPVPDYLPPFVLIASVGTVITLLLGLSRVLRLIAWPERGRQRGFGAVATLLLAWFFASLLLVWLGFYQGSATRTPTLPFGLLIPIVAGVVLYWRWPLLKSIIESAPQEWIVGVQFYRALGLIFLVLYAAGRLPGEFALPAGAGDVLVGLLAPIVAAAYPSRSRGSAGMITAWNLFGLADLVVAVTTGFLTSPSQFQMLALDRPNELISAFPLAMIPVFLVPLSVLLHLASLAKLRRPEQALVQA